MRVFKRKRGSLPLAVRESKGEGADAGGQSRADTPFIPSLDQVQDKLSPRQGGRRSSRRFFFAALIFAPALSFAAAPKSTPLNTVQAVYAALPRPTPPDLQSRRLRILVRKDENRRERNLDFEWRSGGQDSPAITGFRLRLVRVKGDAATVEASFYNRGERRFRRFFLIREAGRWVVDDALLVPENGKLADFLKGKG